MSTLSDSYCSILNGNQLPDQSLITQINYKLADISERLKTGQLKGIKSKFILAIWDKDFINIYLSNKNIVDRIKNYIWGINGFNIRIDHFYYDEEYSDLGTGEIIAKAYIEVAIILTPIKKEV